MRRKLETAGAHIGGVFKSLNYVPFFGNTRNAEKQVLNKKNFLKSFSCARHDVFTQHAFTLNEHN